MDSKQRKYLKQLLSANNVVAFIFQHVLKGMAALDNFYFLEGVRASKLPPVSLLGNLAIKAFLSEKSCSNVMILAGPANYLMFMCESSLAKAVSGKKDWAC